MDKNESLTDLRYSVNRLIARHNRISGDSLPILDTRQPVSLNEMGNVISKVSKDYKITLNTPYDIIGLADAILELNDKIP